MADVTVTVTDNAEQSRYEGEVNGQLAGFAEYHRNNDLVVIPHTEVPRQFQNKGVAGQIVRHALDDIRAKGLRVSPRCPFVAMWIKRHPAYEDLVVR